MGTETVSLRDVRDALGRFVDAAHYRGDITVITKNGEARAAIVPVSLLPSGDDPKDSAATHG
jgi:prevent-host-death family protein